MSRPTDIKKRPNLSFFGLEKAKPGNPGHCCLPAAVQPRETCVQAVNVEGPVHRQRRGGHLKQGVDFRRQGRGDL